ncbi:MAG: SPOR domain-containing protein [Burkholderiaceae bacterium]
MASAVPSDSPIAHGGGGTVAIPAASSLAIEAIVAASTGETAGETARAADTGPRTETVAGALTGAATSSTDAVAAQAAIAAREADAAAGHYLQLAAYSSFDGAEAGRAMLAREAGWIAPRVQVRLDGGLYKLRAGPYSQREQAIRAAERVRQTTGLRPMMMMR